MLLLIMALFGFRKRDKFLDLTEKYKKQLDEATKPQESSLETSPQQETAQGFDFLGRMASGVKTAQPQEDTGVPISGTDEKKKRLAKRLMDMTTKIEDLSNQIYHLQQRIEVLERKSGVGIR